MKTRTLTINPGESQGSFIMRCRSAVEAYRSANGPAPFIVCAIQTGGCYHGHPHKKFAISGLAGGMQPAVASIEPYLESGATYGPTKEAEVLCGVNF